MQSFDFDLIATLRAILDSRYNDLVYHGQNLEKICDFSEYAHWWLSEFQVDPITRKIIKAESYQDEDHERLL